jgi:two-component system phosphate regulon sensor histidine kinase PhoR
MAWRESGAGLPPGRAIGGMMADQRRLPGLWLIRNIGWIATGAAIGSGALMLSLDWPLALAFVLSAAISLAAWFGGKAMLRSALDTGAGSATTLAATERTIPAEPARSNPAGPQSDLVEAFPLPLIITEANEIVAAASRAAMTMFPALSAGRPISLALRNPDLLDALVATRTDGDARTIILDDSTAPGQVMRVHVVAMARPGPLQPSIMCVFEDLTEQRATERMRVDFIANASHELRTPLASLLGFIETLQGPARDDARARERFLPIMREQAGRMARLIDDLLSLSRAELRAHQHPTALTDLRLIVREIVDSLSLSARERGVVLEVSLPDEPMTIRGDRDDLLRLVENLVENGIRYGRDGERVAIGVGAADTGERVFSVRDYGPGIAAQHIPRLTERFYRADVSHSRENGGTGLGLAIVKHLVARHRARLEIESRIGEGATFRVLFPAAGNPADGASE